MIKLDKRDIEAIASNRYIRRYRWWLIGSAILCFGGALGLALLLQGVDDWRKYLSVIPTIALGVGLIFFLRKMSREEKNLVGEWEEGKRE